MGRLQLTFLCKLRVMTHPKGVGMGGDLAPAVHSTTDIRLKLLLLLLSLATILFFFICMVTGPLHYRNKCLAATQLASSPGPHSLSL